MSRKIVRAAQPTLGIAKDPLELEIKRPKVPNYALRGTVYQRGRILSKFALNWLAMRAVTVMLEQVFTSQAREFADIRARLRAEGMTSKPRRLHFELLKELEGAFPDTVGKRELADRLEVTIPQLEQALKYLREFGEVTVGLSVLPDGKGGAGIATLDVWVNYQNMLAAQQVGLERTRQRQGASIVPQTQHIHVREQLPSIQPELFALEDAEVTLSASD